VVPRPEDLTHSNVARLFARTQLPDYDALYRLSSKKLVNTGSGQSILWMVWSKDFSRIFVDLSRGKEFPSGLWR